MFFAWWKLYGFPFDPRLWVAFFVHDLGYWGKPNMDGPRGETHVELGAKIMHKLFDWHVRGYVIRPKFKAIYDDLWGDFTRYHSRFYAKKNGERPSRLCIADKFALCLEPSWLYLPRVNWSGEIHEYMSMAAKRADAGEPYHIGKYASMNLHLRTQHLWYLDVQYYLRKWVQEHKDGKQDSWTPDMKKAVNENGVWQ